MTYLDAMVAAARLDVQARRLARPLAELAWCQEPQRASFEQALREPQMSLIAEFKRRSPSAGAIGESELADTISAYELGGASAISVLTDFTHFQGSLDDLVNAAAITRLPLLRKDFIVDDYQIVEARQTGASAVLLIVAALASSELNHLYDYASETGLDVLVEVHTDHELDAALDIGAPMVGINSRNLHDLTVDLETSIRLARLVPDGVVRVAESGIKTSTDVRRLEDCGFDAILVGESLLRSPDPAAACRILMQPA